MNGTPLSQTAPSPSYPHTSLATLERGLTRRGYQGQPHTNAFSALADYDSLLSTSVAAVFAPLLGLSVAIHVGYHATNISHKEDELATLLDVLLFPAEGQDSAIISSGEFDIEEMGKEVKVSSKVTGNSFILKGTLSILREEWKKDVREAATSTKKTPSPKVVELYNKIVCEEAIALYSTLANGMSDWSEIGRSVIELTRTIQTDVSEGMKREEIINSAIEKLDNACPRALQDPEQANAFIRHLIHLAVPSLSGMAKMKSWFTPPTENRLETFQMAARHITRSNLLVFSGTPREIAAQIINYLDNLSLQVMRLVSVAACDQAEKKLIPHCLKFDQLAIEPSPDGCTYYEHVNIPAVRIKLENFARKEEAAIAQFVVTDNEALFTRFIRSLAKNKHIKTIHFNLHANGLGNNTRVLTRVIQRLSLLPNLTSLNMRGNYLDDRGAEIISLLPNLMHLDISLNQLGPSGAGFISRLSTLMRLEIGGNQVGDRGAESISTLSKLTDLEISRSNMGWRGVEFLSRLPKLTSLNIGSNDLGETGAETLSSLSNLTDLSTGWNDLGKAGAEPISNLQNLTRLDIRSNKLKDTDTQFISTLQNLTNLNIGWNRTGNVGGQFISTLPNLTHLNIADNELGDAGAQFIHGMPNLTSLDISSNSLTDATTDRIVRLPNIKNLDIRFNGLSDKYEWMYKSTRGTF